MRNLDIRGDYEVIHLHEKTQISRLKSHRKHFLEIVFVCGIIFFLLARLDQRHHTAAEPTVIGICCMKENNAKRFSTAFPQNALQPEST